MLRHPLTRLALPFVLGLGLTIASPARLVHAAPDEPKADETPAPKTAKEFILALSAIDKALASDKDYPKSSAAYEKLLAALEKSEVGKADKDRIEQSAQYNYACCLSLQGKKPEAIQAFERSVALGFSDWDHVEKDPDLDAIRGEDGFKAAVEKGKKLAAEAKAKGGSAQLEKAKKQATDALADKPLYDFEFEVTTTDGKPLKLSDLKGKVVIVDFWGTWCPPCRAEIPHFVKLYSELKEKGVEIVGLALEREKDKTKAEKLVTDFAAKTGIKYPLACMMDRAAKGMEIVKRTKGVPTTLFIDKDGLVRVECVGGRDFETIEGLTQGLLDAKPGAGAKKPE